MSEDLFGATFDALNSEERGPGHGAELYERWGTLLSLTEDDEGLHLAESSERGFALRLFRGGRASFAAAGEDGAPELAARARLLVPRARTRRGARAPAPVAGERSEDGPSSRPPSPDELEAREMLTSFRRTLAATGAGHVIAREITVSTGTRHERLATTAGRRARWAVSAATLVATVVGRTPKGRHSARVVATASRLSELPLARLARLAVDRVLLPITGLPAEPTRTDLLLDSHVAAHVVGRLAPLFFGDTHAGLLEARTRQGRDGFASSVVTLVDDGKAPLGPVQTPRDAEGTPVSRTVVVEKGRLAGRLLDVAEAGRTGHAPTGNAVRLSWSEPPQTGVTNFYVDPAAGVSPLDLLAGVTRGYYAAVLLERPDVDAAADRFRLVTAGYALEKGRATERVSEAVLTGRLSDLLRGITALGDDLKLVAGAGGAVGSPTLFIPRWKNG